MPRWANDRCSVSASIPVMLTISGGQDSTVKLFDALSGECLHVLPGLESGTGSIAFSPIGLGPRSAGLIAGGGWNGKLIVWDVSVSGSLAFTS